MIKLLEWDHTVPLVPQHMCFPSSLLSTLVPQFSVADVVHYLQEKKQTADRPAESKLVSEHVKQV